MVSSTVTYRSFLENLGETGGQFNPDLFRMGFEDKQKWDAIYIYFVEISVTLS
jgi:hypothetical protein